MSDTWERVDAIRRLAENLEMIGHLADAMKVDLNEATRRAISYAHANQDDLVELFREEEN